MAEDRTIDLGTGYEETVGIAEALREILGRTLTGGPEALAISNEGPGWWTLRDRSRGVSRAELVAAGEAALAHPVLGGAAMGWLRALAILGRGGVAVELRSGDLFAEVVPGPSPRLALGEGREPAVPGTVVVFRGASATDVLTARRCFRSLGRSRVLASTPRGEILEGVDGAPAIFWNGLKVAEDPSLRFSYDLHPGSPVPASPGRRTLLREVRAVLLATGEPAVLDPLGRDLASGRVPLEVGSASLRAHVEGKTGRSMDRLGLASGATIRDSGRGGRRGFLLGLEPASGRADPAGRAGTADELRVVPVSELGLLERSVLALSDPLFEVGGGRPRRLEGIEIVEGLPGPSWDRERGLFRIPRSALASGREFCAILLLALIQQRASDGPDTEARVLAELLGRLGLRAVETFRVGLPFAA